jgi:hypothetical protein
MRDDLIIQFKQFWIQQQISYQKKEETKPENTQITEEQFEQQQQAHR